MFVCPTQVFRAPRATLYHLTFASHRDTATYGHFAVIVFASQSVRSILIFHQPTSYNSGMIPSSLERHAYRGNGLKDRKPRIESGVRSHAWAHAELIGWASLLRLKFKSNDSLYLSRNPPLALFFTCVFCLFFPLGSGERGDSSEAYRERLTRGFFSLLSGAGGMCYLVLIAYLFSPGFAVSCGSEILLTIRITRNMKWAGHSGRYYHAFRWAVSLQGGTRP